ncbi:hypothetical protein [Pseudomonas sp.]|uniref:hypothetical protein n=1 Tax=Pseudomonas sp. TaxID=306 RepID=UPI002623C215|nr:hypothetical protein [Pseudomonas sp.]
MSDIQKPVATPKHSLSQRIGRGFLLGFGLLIAFSILAVLVNIALLSMFENAHEWEEWRTDHYWLLLVWRLMIYTALTVTWLKLKARQPKSERLKSRKYFLKIELLVVVLILLVEASKFAFQTEGAL